MTPFSLPMHGIIRHDAVEWGILQIVKFLQFQCDVYNMLDGLVPGERINVIDVCKPTSVEVFIKVVCRYILNHQNDGFTKSHIEFSADYRQIYRRPGMPETYRHWNHFYSKK